MRPVHIIVGVGACLASVPLATAHDGPEQVIQMLSDRMEANGTTARLLVGRAFEHRSLGNWDAALADFQEALDLSPRDAAALIGSAETLLRRGDLPEAEDIARKGLTLSVDIAKQAPYHALLARIGARQQQWQTALDSWRHALRSPQAEIDWFLGEAECLAKMGRFEEQINSLERAMTRNASVVLQRAWIRALVEGGEFARATVEIERGLANARWKSAWLLLRAGIHEKERRVAAQQADAAAALDEIRQRLSADCPDPHLMGEVAEARRLLGE